MNNLDNEIKEVNNDVFKDIAIFQATALCLMANELRYQQYTLKIEKGICKDIDNIWKVKK